MDTLKYQEFISRTRNYLPKQSSLVFHNETSENKILTLIASFSRRIEYICLGMHEIIWWRFVLVSGHRLLHLHTPLSLSLSIALSFPLSPA